ncbi:Heat shock protein 26 [Pseudolycoriella hygida]|uniref:Heat shock protein 26 n=1 Tax=Pseudolycoriella hygida TaxID=35572 RepID=A0A9Q0S7G1_9DIPT|nr:Heat shock protein 26 [Pseudolycoriella hygida]
MDEISSSPRKFQDQSIRMRPYFIPERSRTKSESTDTKYNHIDSYDVHSGTSSGKDDSFTSQNDTMMDTSCDNICSSNAYGSATTPPIILCFKEETFVKMSLLPLLLELADDVSPFHRASHFGYGIDPDNLTLISSPSCIRRSCIMPYRRRRNAIDCQRRRQSRIKDMCNGQTKLQTIGKDGFQVCIDVEDFAPNEISVKTVDNNEIVVEAKHEERQDDHGYISRQFTRRYTLPEGYNIKDVASKLSSDGILTVHAPPVERTDDGSKVRVIQIQQTGPAIENVAKDSVTSEENDEIAEKGQKKRGKKAD